VNPYARGRYGYTAEGGEIRTFLGGTGRLLRCVGVNGLDCGSILRGR